MHSKQRENVYSSCAGFCYNISSITMSDLLKNVLCIVVSLVTAAHCHLSESQLSSVKLGWLLLGAAELFSRCSCTHRPSSPADSSRKRGGWLSAEEGILHEHQSKSGPEEHMSASLRRVVHHPRLPSCLLVCTCYAVCVTPVRPVGALKENIKIKTGGQCW